MTLQRDDLLVGQGRRRPARSMLPNQDHPAAIVLRKGKH